MRRDVSMQGTGEKVRRSVNARGTGEKVRRDVSTRGTGEKARRDVSMQGTGEKVRRDVSTRGTGEKVRRDVNARGTGENMCLGKKARRDGAHRARDRPESGRMDYSVYRFTTKEYLQYLGVYALLDGCVSALFFRSPIAFVLLLPGAVLFFREQQKRLLGKRKKEVTQQFLDGIQLMLASLQAGYSSENALREAKKELCKIYTPEALIVREFEWMDAQLGMSRNLEELLLDFGRRSGIPDIVSFAEVFLTAKRTGGDLIAIIQNTVSCIRQKQETLQEIETCLAGKAMEQNIMSVIPVLILAYIRLSSPGFLDVMYETAAGMTVMVICFGVYLLAYLWGQSIVRIEV